MKTATTHSIGIVDDSSFNFFLSLSLYFSVSLSFLFTPDSAVRFMCECRNASPLNDCGYRFDFLIYV